MQRKIITISLLLACFVGGLWLSHWFQTKEPQYSESTLVFPKARTLPNFAVKNHLGKAINIANLKNRWSLMFFGFTHCPDVCPNTLNALTQIQKSFDADTQPQLILVTVDPMRDTPEIMQKYVNSFSDDIIGVTGELHNIQVLTKELGVAYAYNALPDGSYTVDHSATIFIINPQGEYVAAYTSMLNTQDDIDLLHSDLRKLYKSNNK